MNEIFAERLKEARDKQNVTQSELAVRCQSVSTKQIWRYENLESTPSAPRAKEIAKALDVSLDWLMGDDENSMSPHEFAILSNLRLGKVIKALAVIAKNYDD